MVDLPMEQQPKSVAAGQQGVANLAPGQLIAGSYEVQRLLGQGGMGAVWLDQHLRLKNRQVAIKVLHNTAAQGEAYHRFAREAEIAARIGHPNIVDVLDFDRLPTGEPFIVLEFLQGETLRDRLVRGPLPVATTFDLVRQMAAALQAAHACDVVHRDLKPENIFLVPTDSAGEIGERVKILDFGISKLRTSQTLQTQEATVLGTPQYMAPEQAAGRNSEVDGRTDEFALATIVYEMLTGTPPFTADTPLGVMFKVVYEPTPPLAPKLPTLSAESVAALEKALRKDQNERFADVATFVTALTGKPMQVLASRSGKTHSSVLQVGPTVNQAAETARDVLLDTAVADLPAVATADVAQTPEMHAETWFAAPVVTAPTPSALVVVADGPRGPVAQHAETWAGSTSSLPVSPLPAMAPEPSASVALAGKSLEIKDVEVDSPAAALSAARPGPADGVAQGVASTPARPSNSRVHAVLWAGLIGVAAVGAWLALRPASGPPPVPPAVPTAAVTAAQGPAAVEVKAAVVAVAPALAASPVTQPAVGTVDVAASPPAVVGAAAQHEAAPAQHDPPAQHDAARRAEHPVASLPEAAAADLQAAHAALATDQRNALRLGSRALTVSKDVRIYAVMLMAYCKLGDLGGARSVLSHVTGNERRSALRACASGGLDL